MDRITAGMLAHVDSGKTTLCEEMLYISGKIRSKGRVDHGDALLDDDMIERRRGITVYSSQAYIEYGGAGITLLDTPGHQDLSMEMQRTLSVLDAGILIIGANDGITPYTRTLFSLLRKHSVPTFIFVNKMDLALRKRHEIEDIIRQDLTDKAVAMDRGLTESALDKLSLLDDSLTEMVLSGASQDEIKVRTLELVKDGKVFPVFFGTALKGEGVENLMKYLSGFASLNNGYDYEGTPSGMIYKVLKGEEEVSFVKLVKGRITPKSLVTTVRKDGARKEEKINEIRRYTGKKSERLDEGVAGDVVAIKGPKDLTPGDAIGDTEPQEIEEIAPYMTYIVKADDPSDNAALIEAVKVLSSEDPGLSPGRPEDDGGIPLRIMGTVQLEVLTEVLRERFGINAGFSRGSVIYKETLTGEVEGVGHFEPLRHYAEVHLLMYPAERGEGIRIKDSVGPDMLDKNWRNLVLHHIGERPIKGVLTGSEVTDINIELASGKAHKKHTEGGDFREATWRALRQGLMEARSEGKVKILEPWLSFEGETDEALVGRIMTDISNMGGSLSSPESTGNGRALMRGTAPASELEGYLEKLSGLSGGDTRMTTSFDGYGPCHDEEDVIQKKAYTPERDIEHTADSVFCSRGSSDIVPWDEVYGAMHLPSVLEEREKKRMPQDEGIPEEAKRREYREKMAGDKELMAIFERTYGPVKDKNRLKKEELSGVSYQGDVAEKKPAAPYLSKEKKQKLHRMIEASEAAEKWLIIDGYNLIHAWDELTELADEDLGAARDRLADLVSNYSGYTGCVTELVFDAYNVEGGTGSRIESHGITTVYTREHETADSYIEKKTHELMKRNKDGHLSITVVSSDALVQQMSLGHGAMRISSREFIEEMAEAAFI